jgi:hypothetical protein
VVSYQVLEPHRDLLRYTNTTNFWWQLGILLLALYYSISYQSIPSLHACGNIVFANLLKCSGIEDRNPRSICWPFYVWHIKWYAYFSRQCLDLPTHGSSALVALHATAWLSKRVGGYTCISFHHAYQTSRQQSDIAAVSDKEDQVSRGRYLSPFCETTGDRVEAAHYWRRSIHPSGRPLLDIVRSDCIDV